MNVYGTVRFTKLSRYTASRRLPDQRYRNFELTLDNLHLFSSHIFYDKRSSSFLTRKMPSTLYNTMVAPVSRLRGIIHALIQSCGARSPRTGRARAELTTNYSISLCFDLTPNGT